MYTASTSKQSSTPTSGFGNRIYEDMVSESDNDGEMEEIEERIPLQKKG